MLLAQLAHNQSGRNRKKPGKQLDQRRNYVLRAGRYFKPTETSR
jgi:hypothetical protein